MNGKQDDSVVLVTKNAIRNNTGNIQIYQCHPKLTTERKVSQHITDFDRKTVGDINNKRLERKRMLYMVLNHNR